jgi:hypothetical protein
MTQPVDIPRLLPLAIAIPLAALIGLGLRIMKYIQWAWLRWIIRILTIMTLFHIAYEAGEISTLTAAMMFGYGIWTVVEKLEKGEIEVTDKEKLEVE